MPPMSPSTMLTAHPLTSTHAPAPRHARSCALGAARRTTTATTPVHCMATASSAPAVTFRATAAEASQRPSLPRSGACAATLPPSHSHDALLFGGYTEELGSDGVTRKPTNEAWLFSAAAGAWSPVACTGGALPPPTRLAAQCVVVGNRLWLIGGWDSSVSGPDAFLGDVWTLDLQSYAWQQQQLAGEVLEGLSRHQAVADGARIFIHSHRCTDHILVLHADASPPRLEKVPVSGEVPSSRGLSSLVKVANALYLFGGALKSGPMLDDLYRLDLSTMAWERLTPGGTTPHARCSSAFAAVPGARILYFGGAFYGASGGLEMLGDAHVYDTQANAWLVPAVEGNLPAARNAGVMVPLPQRQAGDGAKLLLSGGWKAFVETFNDSFLVQLAP